MSVRLLKMWSCLLAGVMLAFFLLAGGTAQAQEDGDPNEFTDTMITYDAVVNDTITDSAFYDFYHFRAAQGDVVVITMIAADGLAPLLGLSDSSREIIARSDVDGDGTPRPDARPNDTVEIEIVIPEEGEYLIVPTRVGNQAGTTTGSYTLLLRRANPGGVYFRDTQDVTFRCRGMLVTTAATLEFSALTLDDAYTLTVYGLDDFQPVIRVVAGLNQDLNDCGRDFQHMEGDQFTIPGEETVTLEGDLLEQSTRYGLAGGRLLDRVRFTIGSEDGSPGRYLIVLEGLRIAPTSDRVGPGNRGFMEVRLGPLAASTEMLVYMVRSGDSRLDPFLRLLVDEDADEIVCDDAGRRGCEDVPSLVDYGVIFADGREIIGDRFSAGLRLSPGDTDAMGLQFSSAARGTHGDYAVFIIGELPPR